MDATGFIKCDSCGVAWKLTTVYRRVSVGFRKKQLLCPTCWAKRKAQSHAQSLQNWISWGIAGLLILSVTPEAVFGWLLLTIILFVALQMVCVVIHELGHAMCAWVLGMRV